MATIGSLELEIHTNLRDLEMVKNEVLTHNETSEIFEMLKKYIVLPDNPISLDLKLEEGKPPIIVVTSYATKSKEDNEDV